MCVTHRLARAHAHARAHIHARAHTHARVYTGATIHYGYYLVWRVWHLNQRKRGPLGDSITSDKTMHSMLLAGTVAVALVHRAIAFAPTMMALSGLRMGPKAPPSPVGTLFPSGDKTASPKVLVEVYADLVSLQCCVLPEQSIHSTHSET